MRYQIKATIVQQIDDWHIHAEGPEEAKALFRERFRELLKGEEITKLSATESPEDDRPVDAVVEARAADAAAVAAKKS